jgi:serine/threonine protein kinase
LSTPIESSSSKPGDRVGRYKLLSEVHDARLGPLWVLQFRHERQWTLALGRLHGFNEEGSEEEREGLTEHAWDAMDVDHECVVHAGDVVIEGSKILMVYDYLEGLPLSVLETLRRERGAPLATELAVRVMLDLLSGLAAVHAVAKELGTDAGFGGVSADSVLVGSDGRARLLDIFVAGPVRRLRAKQRLESQAVLPSPQQLASGHEASVEADVYYAGILLCDLLSPGLPSEAEPDTKRDTKADLQKINKRGDVDEELLAVLRRALAEDPKQRFASVAEMLGHIEGLKLAVAAPAALSSYVEQVASDRLRAQRQVTENSATARIAELLFGNFEAGHNAKQRKAQATPQAKSDNKGRQPGAQPGVEAGRGSTPNNSPPSQPSLLGGSPEPAPERRSMHKTQMGLAPAQRLPRGTSPVVPPTRAALEADSTSEDPDSEETTEIWTRPKTDEQRPAQQKQKRARQAAGPQPRPPTNSLVPAGGTLLGLPRVGLDPTTNAATPPPASAFPAQTAAPQPVGSQPVAEQPAALEAPSVAPPEPTLASASERPPPPDVQESPGPADAPLPTERTRRSGLGTAAARDLQTIKSLSPGASFFAGMLVTLAGVGAVSLLRAPEPIMIPVAASATVPWAGASTPTHASSAAAASAPATTELTAEPDAPGDDRPGAEAALAAHSASSTTERSAPTADQQADPVTPASAHASIPVRRPVRRAPKSAPPHTSSKKYVPVDL